MSIVHPDLAKCHSFVVCHLSDEQKYPIETRKVIPFVTISRQAGAGGRTLGKALKMVLDKTFALQEGEWTVFDRNLVETAMKLHGLPKRFAQYLPEAHVSEIKSIIRELLGVHPPLWELNQHIFETLLNLARIGGVVLVGRGAHIVTRRLGKGLHVRLVGSIEKRVERLAKNYEITEVEALRLIEREDKARRIWVKENFQEDIGDPSCYDLCINTDSISMTETAVMISELFGKRFL